MKSTYIDHMGTDLSTVNAARVSFGKASDWVYSGVDTNGPAKKALSKRDKGLIQFLARGCTSGDWEDLAKKAALAECGREDEDGGFVGSYEEIEEVLRYVKNMPTHWTPFGHTSITLHIEAPIFIARQLGKHQVGMVWNEVSRRYVKDEPKFYNPKVWRKTADNVKQGSSDEPADLSIMSQHTINGYWKYLAHEYARLLKDGVCPEQARMILPQSMYTEWYWTGNLYSFANVFIQRSDSHAQREVQEVARQIGEIIEPLFPVSWAALTA